MFIRITDGAPELVDAFNFNAFHVERGGLATTDILGALGDKALAGDDEHVWLSAIGVAELAGVQAAGEWITKFDGMCQYAESKGWMNEAGTHIRAHLE